jgi:hypothetical protein
MQLDPYHSPYEPIHVPILLSHELNDIAEQDVIPNTSAMFCHCQLFQLV